MCAALSAYRPSMQNETGKLRVLIAGGGIAALEAAAALRALAPGRVSVTLLTPSTDFAMRASAVRQPFDYPPADRYDLAALAGKLNAAVVADTLAAVDVEARVVRTGGGEHLPYDALLIATGARSAIRYEHAITVDDRTVDQRLHALLADIDAEAIHSVAFVAPPEMAWPIPLYELALMTKQYAWTRGHPLTTLLVTSEDEPLHLFGSLGSRNISRLLRAAEVQLATSSFAEVPADRQLVLLPGDRMMSVDRVVSLPELLGPRIPGLPHDEGGFLPIDDFARVEGTARVFAAGDATNLPVKHGGLGAQTADAAARCIAALAGADVAPEPIEKTVRAMILTGTMPVYLTARREGGYSYDPQFSEEPLWEPAEKVPTRYLSPLLRTIDAARTQITP